VQLTGYIGGSQTQRRQFDRIYLDPNFTLHAPDTPDGRETLDCTEFPVDNVIDEPGKRFLIHHIRRHRVSQYWSIHSLKVRDRWLLHFRRQL
jgi:hypothetical protein